MTGNRRHGSPERPLCKTNWALLHVVCLIAALSIIGCRWRWQPSPTPYDGMVKQLHPGMTSDAVESRLGKPYLSAYNVGNRVSAIYRADGTILPFIVRFQEAESLVIHDPSAPLDSWCAYVRTGGSGASSVLVFAPTNMSASETANWISRRPDGFSFPGQADITDADPDRPRGDGGETKLMEARSVHQVTNAGEDGSSGLVQMDSLKLRLACHPIL